MPTKDNKKPSNKVSKTSSNTNTPSKVTSLKSKQNPNQNTPKKLTVANINKLATDFKEKRKVYIKVKDEEFEILINTIFRKSEVEKVCLEFLELFAKSMQIEGIDERELMKNIEKFLQVFVLKNFTNIPIPKVDDISKLTTLTNNLYDLGILEEFFVKNVDLIGKENFDVVNETFNKIASNIGQVVSNKALLSELVKLNEDEIDVDDYFAELESRNFEIVEDEDLSLLPRVIDQLNANGKYEEYMSKLTLEELDKLDERLKLFNSTQGEEENGEEV